MGEDSAPESGEASDHEGPALPLAAFQVTAKEEPLEEEGEEKVKVEGRPRREVREVSPLMVIPAKQRKQHSPSPEESKCIVVSLLPPPLVGHPLSPPSSGYLLFGITFLICQVTLLLIINTMKRLPDSNPDLP